jgi:hypothetical protein
VADGGDAGRGDRVDATGVERDRHRRTRALPPFLDLLDEFGSEWEWEDYVDRKPVSSLTTPAAS